MNRGLGTACSVKELPPRGRRKREVRVSSQNRQVWRLLKVESGEVEVSSTDESKRVFSNPDPERDCQGSRALVSGVTRESWPCRTRWGLVEGVF